ncbi:hypothetical protein FSPOR_7790 [Fusarium sporotrichioides]|uniref:Xylanolytic transcriptional activator regulatory domain-containing protein n=1 Tax=Fusarium sporotrichioides TaxID=5514 RepID=A0A395RX34_FUSSP|nr:hypothetical protein FSPOR_7790 [Fusarium sporotrichioides]
MEKTIESFRAQQDTASPQATASTTTSVTSANTPVFSETVTASDGFIGQAVLERREGLLLNKGRYSHYVNEVLLSRVIEQEDDVRTALATPRDELPHDINSPASPFNPMTLLSPSFSTESLASFHPPRKTAIRLWKIFVDNVDVCTKVTHLPTSETILYTVMRDPTKASIETLTFCFAIYYASVTASSPEDVLNDTGEDRKQALQRYKICLEQSLAQADFLNNPTITLLQALAIYTAAMRVHNINSGRAVWIMNGLSLRAAQSIGLHRDGSKLGLPPFESEIRRRVWWHFLERDGRGAEDYGLQNPSDSGQMYGVEQPRNLHDSDIFPGMKELPPSRPDFTRMTLPLCNCQASRAWAQIFQMSLSPEGVPSEDARKKVIQEAMDKVEGILQRCNSIIPEQRMQMRISRLVLRKVDLVSRRQWQALRQPDDRECLATETDVAEAVDLLELANDMWRDEDMIAYRWIARAYPQYHMMLYILRHLCVRPGGPLASKAFAAVDMHLESFRLSGGGPLNGLKWTVLTTLRDRALVLMQRVEKESRERQVESENLQGVVDGDLATLDWTTILEEFQMDVEDFSLIF